MGAAVTIQNLEKTYGAVTAGIVVDSWPVTRSAVAAVSRQLEPLVSLLPF